MVAAVRACTAERAQAMRAACERRALLFSDEVFESRLLATVNRLAADKGLMHPSKRAESRTAVATRPRLAF